MKKLVGLIAIFFVLLFNRVWGAQENHTYTLSPDFQKEQPEINLGTKPVEGTVEEQNKAQVLKNIPVYEKISLPCAIDYALKYNLDMAGNRLNIDIARNDIKKAGRFKNPDIISWWNSGSAATDNPNYIGPVLPIEIAKRGARKKLAKSSYELTLGKVALAELTLNLDVREAYVYLVANKSYLKILKGQKELLEELLDIAQKKYEAGAVPQMDVIHAKMTLNQLLIQFNSANTYVYSARYNFNRLLNSQCFDSKEDYLPEQKDFISIITPDPLMKMPDFQEFCEFAFEKRLDFKNAQKDIEVARKNLIVVTRQRVPDFEIGVGYMFVPQAKATDDQFSQGMYLIGNITNIPLLYQYTPEIKNAKLELEQKLLAYKSLRNKAVMNLHRTYDEFITAQDNLNYYNDVLLNESKEFLNLSRRSYEVGKSNMTDFIFVQQSYKNIMMNYVQALANYYDTWINVLREVQDPDFGNKLSEEPKQNG